ncbi:MAG: TIM barrel protein [Thermoguttaceae bacterium]|jgi:sugar phosphate isomerase/epimerase
MKNESFSRRRFLRTATAGVVAAGLSARATAWAQQPPAKPAGLVRLGGPVFHAPKDPEELALAHRKLGYRAAYCPGIPLDDHDRIRDVSRAFAKHDVVLAEVGRWCNLMDLDPARRAANLRNVTEGLALAEEVGARCCVDIAGSFNPKVWYGPHPKNLSKDFFDAAVENARKIIDAVRPKRAKLSYEMMGWALPDTPDAYLAMLRAIDRPAMAVHLDACNVVNCPARFYDTTAVVNECFDKLGQWIVSCHAKDLAWSTPVEMNVHIVEVIPGAGILDYATYLKRVAALPGEVPLMLEHLKTAEEYDQGRKYIMETGVKAGVRFE